jgi:hypothetical protein
MAQMAEQSALQTLQLLCDKTQTGRVYRAQVV